MVVDVDGLERAEQVARLRLVVQVDHHEFLAEELGEMLENGGLSDARLSAEQDRLVALDASSHLLEELQRLGRVNEGLVRPPETSKTCLYQLVCLVKERLFW